MEKDKGLKGKGWMAFRKAMTYMPLLSAVILGGCAAVALHGYDAAAFGEASGTVGEMEIQAAEGGQGQDFGQETEAEAAARAKAEAAARAEAAAKAKAAAEAEAAAKAGAAADDAEGFKTVELSKIADGKYEGEGSGFGGKIRVSVEIRDHKIVSIQIISASGEDASYFSRAKGVIERILAAQSLEVDTVSGATYSSRGIIRAVRNALSGETDNGQPASPSPGAKEAPSIPPANEGNQYRDGVYEGSGQGFAGEIEVRVTIAGGRIESIEIISSSDGAAYLEKASALLDRMIHSQNTNVDAVSGATYSSAGIVSAVRDALSRAQAAGGAESGSGETKEPQQEAGLPAATGAFPYQDGIYYGTAVGFSGDLTVAVALQEKTIKAILVTKSADDASYLSRAKAVADEIIKKQSTKVDAVSGATYSSKGIRNAVRNALKAAKRGKDGGEEVEAGTQKQPEKDSAVTGTIPYKEGVYFGTGTGFQGDVEAAVAISEKTIKAIVVTKTEDDEKFFSRARTVLAQILKKQSVKVDAVSGATYSSRGIIEAVGNALAKAKKATENPDSGYNFPGNDTENPDSKPSGDDTGNSDSKPSGGDTGNSDSKPSGGDTGNSDSKPSGGDTGNSDSKPSGGDTGNPDSKPSGDDTGNPDSKPSGGGAEKPGEGSGTKYRDGTYPVSVICYPDEWEEFESYTLSATVTIRQDKIVSVTDLAGDGGSENRAFIKRAANGTNKKPGVVAQILETGDVQGVDAVSAATCSSQAILEACSQALQKAKK